MGIERLDAWITGGEEKDRRVGYCYECGIDIYEGEEYYELDYKYFCSDCVREGRRY